MSHDTHRWDVFRGKLVGGVGYEQARLSHRTVTHHHTLYSLHLRRMREEREEREGAVEDGETGKGKLTVHTRKVSVDPSVKCNLSHKNFE